MSEIKIIPIQGKCFGARVVVTMNNGKKYIEQLERADAHPYGARPFIRKDYINKFKILCYVFLI